MKRYLSVYFTLSLCHASFRFASTGGLSCFRQSHENLCEHSLHLHQGLDTGAAAGLTGPLPHSLPSTPDIENAELTPILPFLYLGNEHDAQDIHPLQRFNIGYVLNVTTHLPLYHYDTGFFVYKRLPATDSNKQNLRQYFEEAFEFIGMKTSTVFKCKLTQWSRDLSRQCKLYFREITYIVVCLSVCELQKGCFCS